MTFICELNQYSMEIYRMFENELPMAIISKVIVLNTANACIQLIVATFGSAPSATDHFV